MPLFSFGCPHCGAPWPTERPGSRCGNCGERDEGQPPSTALAKVVGQVNTQSRRLFVRPTRPAQNWHFYQFLVTRSGEQVVVRSKSADWESALQSLLRQMSLVGADAALFQGEIEPWSGLQYWYRGRRYTYSASA